MTAPLGSGPVLVLVNAGAGSTEDEQVEQVCRLLAARSGVNEAAIWEWGFLERISSGLYLLQLGADDLGRQYLDSAERLSMPGHR